MSPTAKALIAVSTVRYRPLARWERVAQRLLVGPLPSGLTRWPRNQVVGLRVTVEGAWRALTTRRPKRIVRARASRPTLAGLRFRRACKIAFAVLAALYVVVLPVVAALLGGRA
jgi:hypothetical protein